MRAYSKWIRDAFYIGQSEIATSLGISIGTYSKMEQGTKIMRDEDFKAIIHFYEMKKGSYSFCFDEKKRAEANGLIRKCIGAFVYRDQKTMLPILKEYLMDEKNWHCPAFFETNLLQMIYEYFCDLSFQERFSLLFDHEYLFDPSARSILHDLYGLSKLRKYDESAIHSFQTAKALSVFQPIPGWMGLIDYHMIITFLRFMKPEKAYSLFEECRKDIQNSGSHRRLLDPQLNEAQCFMKLGLREEADTIYQTMLQTYGQVDDDSVLKEIYGNYAWNQLMQRNDIFAIELAKKAIQFHATFPDIYITLAYSNYRLDRAEEALQVISTFRNQKRTDNRSKMVLLFLDVLESLLLERKKKFERKATQLLPRLQNWKDLEVDIFVYLMLIDHYANLQDWQSLCFYQAEMIKFLGY